MPDNGDFRLRMLFVAFVVQNNCAIRTNSIRTIWIITRSMADGNQVACDGSSACFLNGFLFVSIGDGARLAFALIHAGVFHFSLVGTLINSALYLSTRPVLHNQVGGGRQGRARAQIPLLSLSYNQLLTMSTDVYLRLPLRVSIHFNWE